MESFGFISGELELLEGRILEFRGFLDWIDQIAINLTELPHPIGKSFSTNIALAFSYYTPPTMTSSIPFQVLQLSCNSYSEISCRH